MSRHQTLNQEGYPNLLAYYAALVCFEAKNLKRVSKHLAVDAYSSRFPFVDEVCATGLQIISRLRNDADLLYPYVGPHPKRRGAKTKYLGKFDPRNLDEACFSCCIKLYSKSNYILITY